MKHALGCLDHTLVCFARDVVVLKTTGQCLRAVVKVPESLCQFEDSATRIRLSRCNSGTLSLAFSKFEEDELPRGADPWLVVLDLPYALVAVSNDVSLCRAQGHVVSTQLKLGRSASEKL